MALSATCRDPISKHPQNKTSGVTLSQGFSFVFTSTDAWLNKVMSANYENLKVTRSSKGTFKCAFETVLKVSFSSVFTF